MPEDTQALAEKLVKKMSVDDMRMLMCKEGAREKQSLFCPLSRDASVLFTPPRLSLTTTGIFKAPKSDKEYDQYEVGKTFVINSMSLDIKDVKANAIKAMVKRIERGDENVPVSTKIDS